MKIQALKYITALVILAGIFQLSGCKKSDPTPSAQDVVKKNMESATWVVKTVTVDGVDQTSVYQGLTIKFTDNAYTTTNGKAIWPASGTWTFTSADGTTIKRDDGLVITVAATSTSLQLSLTWAETTLGRVSSVAGLHVFTFVKQ